MNSQQSALEMLVQRLQWPVKLVRWKAAKAIRSMIEAPDTHDNAMNALLNWIASRKLESEVITGLSVLLITAREARPSFGRLSTSIDAPSLGAEFLISELYGFYSDQWRHAHGGTVPTNFVAESYFLEHRTAHIPPVLKHELEYLEKRTKMPFLQQWAYEWTQLRQRDDATYTRYPHYFGDYSLFQEGIIGQFIQYQGELYRSAYQRVLACAADEWRLPFESIAPFATFGLPTLPDLFELEPATRPAWLPVIDEPYLKRGNLKEIAKSVLALEPQDEFQTVSIRLPLTQDCDEFGELALSAYFYDDDFELEEHQELHSALQLMQLRAFRFNGVRPQLSPKPQHGAKGIAVPVCSQTMPMSPGYWHDDYYQRGLTLPAPYCYEQETIQEARTEGLFILIANEVGGHTATWFEGWTPMYGPNSATRCGILTRIRKKDLRKTVENLGLKVGWFVQLSRMRKNDGEYKRTPQNTSDFLKV